MTSHKSKRRNGRDAAAVKPAPRNILTINVGGRNVKLLATGHHEPVKIRSGKTMTPSRLVTAAQRATKKWKFDAVSIGYPGLVRHDGPHSEPLNLGPGWVGFDFAAAFGKPVRIINDAAMQALGSYNGGRMLFIGLGTGLGSALITENVVVPLELGELPYGENERLGMVVGHNGLKQLGKKKWRIVVSDMLNSFARAFVVDYIVLGGGNAKLFRQLPGGVRLGHNLTAFRGGFRLWNVGDVTTLTPSGRPVEQARPSAEWRVV